MKRKPFRAGRGRDFDPPYLGTDGRAGIEVPSRGWGVPSVVLGYNLLLLSRGGDR